MEKIVLIACASKKKDTPALARNLYESNLFNKNLRYAQLMKPEKIFVLSAKHGLLPLDRKIAPYDKSLNSMGKNERKEWAKEVIGDLEEMADLNKDKFIILAGKQYREFLVPQLKNYEIPLKNRRIGEQLQLLNKKIDIGEKCSKLHSILRQKKRFTFPFAEDKIPNNGIYVLFEKGELGHKGDRIVRIGTHRGEGELTNRLKQHFIKKNKDRSIFRKNIGRCFLNRTTDPFLEKWNLDLTSRKMREKYSEKVDFDYQEVIENRVTGYIQGTFTFAFIQIPRKYKRLLWEARLISTISSCEFCKPSNLWLGRHSPKKKIRESGLWQEQELYKKHFSDSEFEKFIDIVKSNGKEIELVETVDEVRDNIKQFNQEIEKGNKELRNKLGYFKIWYYDKKLDMFGPSKFIGYKNMTARKHGKIYRNKLDGRETVKVLANMSKAFEKERDKTKLRNKLEILLQEQNKTIKKNAIIRILKD